jgi:outer membrane immunogenic protein
MRMLLVGALALGLSGPVMAQDYNWSGIYLGAHGGYAWGDASTTDDIKDWCTPGDTACIAKFVGPFAFDLEGGFGGGTIGLNWQYQALVFGLEADLGYLDLTGSRKTDSSNPTKFQTLNVDGGLYAILGGRVGFTFGRTLLYGKGGWLYYDTDVTQTTTNPGYKTNGSGALDGVAYGGGIEHALGGGWSLKAEYLHFDFNTADGDQTSVSDPPIGHVYENSTDLDADSVKIGINYMFGGERAPIVPLK